MNWLTNLNTQWKWEKTCAMESTGDEYEKKKKKKRNAALMVYLNLEVINL